MKTKSLSPRIKLDVLAIKKMEEIYATLPTVQCKGLCQSVCEPIIMTKTEYDRIAVRTKKKPDMVFDLDNPHKQDCPLLKDGRCSVYDIRPLVCRMYGAAEGLKCGHGCEISSEQPKEETRKAIKRANRISEESTGYALVLPRIRGMELLATDLDKQC